jgi:hypothetical protein
MLAFGVVCLAFDVDDDPEHMSCGGGTVRRVEQILGLAQRLAGI